MAATTKTLLTAEEFMDRYAGEGSYELVRGEVVELSPGMSEHARICARVCFALETYGRQSGFGYALSNDMAVVTERCPDTVRGADVSFYSHARVPEKSLQPKLLSVAPDLVVEVYSKSDRPGEMRKKINEYLDAGVLMVWVVYPERRTVNVYRAAEPIVLNASEMLESLPELPGFRCPVSDFFPVKGEP
jgi:Uma2 family endonuclease